MSLKPSGNDLSCSVATRISREATALSAVKSRTRAHSDSKAHNEVVEINTALAGNLCPLI